MRPRQLEYLSYAALLAATLVLVSIVQLPPWELTPVQSLHVFANLDVFVGTYIIWLWLLLALLWRSRHRWQCALLVGIFALVHVGVIVLATPYGAFEDWLKAGDTVQIQTTTGLHFRGYSDYPGLALLGSFLASVAGRDILSLRTYLLMIWLFTLSVLAFVAYARMIKSGPQAGLSVLLALQSNIVLARFYWHPSILGVLLFITFLALLLARERQFLVRERLLTCLLMAGVTIVHLVSSIAGLIVVAGHYLEQKWRHRDEPGTKQVLALGVILVTAWGIYWTSYFFVSVILYFRSVGTRFLSGDPFAWIYLLIRANTYPLPLWAVAVQYFWWVAVYLMGGLIALRILLTRDRTSSAAVGYSASYVMLTGAAVLGTIVSPGGYDFYRIIMYGSFLAAPLVVYYFLQRLRVKFISVAASGIFIALSFPTLLAHNTSIGWQATHPSELVAAQFLAAQVNESSGPTRLFGGFFGPDMVTYYAPRLTSDAIYLLIEGPVITSGKQGRAIWRSRVDEFLRSSDPGIFLFDRRDVLYFHHLLQFPDDDALWARVRQDLNPTNLFYDDGSVQLYRHRQ